MKKLASLFFAAVIAAVICGCTSVESTQKLNAIKLTDTNMQTVCQSHVRIWGWYFCGLPVVVGSPAGDGKCTVFRYTNTTENVMYLLTKEVRSKGASRLVNTQVLQTSSDWFLPIFTFETIQASGVGVRPAGNVQ